MPKGCRDSGNGESKGLEKPLKKGPWSSDEDAILIDYVKKHGTGKWNAVQKYSGLSRCGKSCRLRWLNHLRPDLRKGAFTSEEERTVMELHAIYGSKWAKMADMLPGRTDNEIKNFWNTRQKRLSRAGLPIYPDHTGQVRFNADQSGQNINALAIGYAQDQGAAVGSGGAFVIPEIKFEHLDLKPDYYEWLLSSLPNFITNQGGDPFRMYLPAQSSQFNSLPDSHLLGNVTYPYSSVPFTREGKNLELPSIQHVNTQDTGAWDANTSIVMLPQESADTSIHSPDQTPSNCPSSHYDGMLVQSPSPVSTANSSGDNSWDEFTMNEFLAML